MKPICHSLCRSSEAHIGNANDTRDFNWLGNVLAQVSVVVPVRNDLNELVSLLNTLRNYPTLEVVIVDSSDTDSLQQVLKSEISIRSQPSRGRQIRIGVEATQRKWIWMLHADTALSEVHLIELATHLDDDVWGRFDVRFDVDRYILRIIATFMNWRSAISGICTGDMGIFASHSLLDQIDGIPDQPLMEDIELSKRLKNISKPIRIKTPIMTTARKWVQEGVVRTIIKMWYYRLRYFFGASPEALFNMYYSSK